MIGRFCAVVVVTTLAAGSSLGRAQPPPGVVGSNPALEEAKRLTATVEKLYAEGKFEEAVSPALRSLSLREKTLGPRHPDVAMSLNNLALLYRYQGAYAKAEPLFVRALGICEKTLGPMHPGVATTLHNLADLYQDQGAYTKAEPLFVRALDIWEKALGPMHPNVATSLNDLAIIYQDQGAYAKAEKLFVRALGIREEALGPKHPTVAMSLNNLAFLYQYQGAYAKAEPLFVRALGILEEVLGPMHPDVARSLNSLASLYQDQGIYAKAEPLFVRALGIREQALGPTHPDVAASLNSLALLYRYQGAYAKAEPLFVRALGIWEKALGPMHPDVATGLNNLAGLYQDQGTYAKVEPLLVRALGIWETALGPMHPDVARGLNNLAGLYQYQGAYAKAEPLFVRALGILEEVLGPVHPTVAMGLNNLALLYQHQGEYARAEPLFVRALGIWEKALGPMHPNVGRGLGNLASLYGYQGAYAKAESLFVRALGIWEKALGPMHPDVATTLHNLADLYRVQRTYAKAEPLLVRALGIREKSLGPMHPDVASSLNSLAFLYSAQGKHGRALPLMTRAAAIREGGLRVELPRLSEPRKRALMKLLQGETDRLVSLHVTQMPRSQPALDVALATVLRRKGRILDSLVENEAALRAHLTPLLRGQLDRLAQARTDLVARLYARTDPRSTRDHDAIKDARARLEELESALSAASAEFRARSEPVTVAKIQAALPRGAALVEFVRYRRHDARRPRRPWQEERYVAILLMSQGPPQAVALGTAAAIDSEVDSVLAKMDGRVAPEIAKAALQRLDALVFAPVRARLTNVSHVIMAPDSRLNLVPFEALVDPDGHYALEGYLISYVTTGRDLLRLGVRHRPRSSGVIIAGPDYGPVSSPWASRVAFVPLAGALGEATDLRRYFSISPLTGARATKPALKALTGPAMLHVATHGFYARDAGITPRNAPIAGLAQREHERGMSVEEDPASLPPSTSEDPIDSLDRAGLALADANQGAEGILTAREVAGLDLWGTQLVVLSACETGVGAVPSGEGVYGLRRALVLAGAESQVVTLWNVGDSSTRELMREFYGELARGTGRAEALRQAKLRLMRQPGRAHPYYWAAFIPAGDWRPLDKGTIRH